MGTHKQHHHWTYSSDETSEERLARQVASHVNQIAIGEGGIEVLVVASLSFLRMLTSLLPIGAVVKADHNAPLSAEFDVRVTVVATASTATFELKSVGKVTPKTELVKIGNRKWAKELTEFARLTNAGQAACFQTLAGGMLYNMYVEFDELCSSDPTMMVPTQEDLKNLVSYYEGKYPDDTSRVAAMKRDLRVQLAGFFVNTAGLSIVNNAEGWWAYDKCTGLVIYDSEDFSGIKILQIQKDDGKGMGISVRLIQKTTAA
jgi:hypothetical protein